MDFLRKYDIILDKDVYYVGERIQGHVLVKSSENIKVKGIRLSLRGKAHVDWKITRGGERRTVKEDQYFVDDRRTIWGIDKSEPDTNSPILPRGEHSFSFTFQLPESNIPCSFESKIGTIRYYIRVVIDVPYASNPNGIKYFSVIGPHTDCMEEKYLSPYTAVDKKNRCCLCCRQGPILIRAVMDRSGYCCGETIKLKAQVQNGSGENAWIICRLVQYVEYFINKGVLGLTKELRHTVWEYKGQTVGPHTSRHDNLREYLQVPVMPPTLLDICRCIQIYYVLELSLGMEKTGEELEINFPLTIASVPFRIPSSLTPRIIYEPADVGVEGGRYISPEFELGQVYDGSNEQEGGILYKPLYVTIPHNKLDVNQRSDSAVQHSVTVGPEHAQTALDITETPEHAQTALDITETLRDSCEGGIELAESHDKQEYSKDESV